jgi:hypothetical protein
MSRRPTRVRNALNSRHRREQSTGLLKEVEIEPGSPDGLSQSGGWIEVSQARKWAIRVRLLSTRKLTLGE